METAVQEGLVGVEVTPSAPPLAQRLALRVLQVGAVAVVLAAVTDRAHELDRFFVPKELVLHVTALLAGLFAVGLFRRVALTRVDLLLIGYLLLSAVSAIMAEDRALAARALGISVSGVTVFWTARALRDVGLGRPLLRILALAVLLGGITSLVQAYGVQSDFFSINRAPGGTLGNRNFIAHLVAFGLPLIVLNALRAWRAFGYLIGSLGIMTVVASLVLTRSRAGWLAFGAVIFVFAVAMLFSPGLRRHRRTWTRMAGVVLLIGAGAAGAILLPNSLRWTSENPYLESMTGIANFQEGSGRGRLVQYSNSMRIALDNPLFGAGPGNWPLAYPDYAGPGDPSMSRSQPGTTSNPWPSSDWVAFIAERGFPAALLLAFAFVVMAISGARRLFAARDEEEGAVAAAMVGVLLATIIAGMFDAVLLLAHPTLVVWAALGTLWPPGPRREDPMPSRVKAILMVVLVIGAGVAAVQSARELSTMTLFGANLETPSGMAAKHALAGASPPHHRVL